MPTGWAVDAAGAVGGRAAPNALVRAGAMPMLARRRMKAAQTVGRRTAPLAVFLVVSMLMLARGQVNAPAPVTRRSAMSAFSCHVNLHL